MKRMLLVLAMTAACTADVSGTEGDGVAGSQLDDADKGAGDGAGMLAQRACAAGATVAGVDVSYYNSTINWTKVKAAGIGFVIVRVSDGMVFHDPKFATYWAGAKQAGLVRGAYQFFRPNQSVTAQADLMISAIGTPQPGDLPPIIDVEVTGGVSPASLASKVQTWVARVKQATGVQPIIYTGKYFWRDQVGGANPGTAPLWIAQYTSQCPDLPRPWTTWAFWQHSESGRVSGISGQVDLNTFNGSLDELQAFAGMGTPDPGTGSGSATTCTSATMGRDINDGECVQSAADQSWYQCDAGQWTAIAATDTCTATYGWCDSATLGQPVAPRSCVQSAADNTWYQCDGTTWVSPVDSSAGSGPAGLCSEMYFL
jgi:GH25 family lysozyme M1 (1,4-beta-N-acetylmuramidase)